MKLTKKQIIISISIILVLLMAVVVGGTINNDH